MPNESPISEEENELLENKAIQDLVATALFGFGSYASASSSDKAEIRNFLEDFVSLISNVENVIKAIQNKDVLFPEQEKVIRILYNNREILDEFIKGYTQVLDFRKSAIEQGYDIFMLIDQVYPKYLEKRSAQEEQIDESDYIREQFKLFGYDENGESIFVPYFDHIDSYSKIKDRFFIRENGKFRPNVAPNAIARWQCRIGSSNFFVPPTSINVSQVFKTTSFGGAIRQHNTPKMNTGHSETQINITLYFPNHENIWGFRGDKADFNIFNWDPNPVLRADTFEVYGQKELVSNATVSDQVIDRYLSSLRGLITQFKYAPFLPIKNEYLNRTYGITAVALSGLTVSTMEGFPFVLVVNLQLAKFNFTPLMPMIDDFDQAIHWGKFRQYMGKAAARLDSLVNQGFLVRGVDESKEGSTSSKNIATYEGDLLPRLDKLADITNGANFEFYFPVSTPARIFAPDTTDFRQPSEDSVVTSEQWGIFIFDILGFDLVTTPQFNFFEYDRAYKNKTIRGQRKVLWDWMQSNKIALNLLTPENQSKFIEYIVKEGKKTGAITPSNEEQIREDLKTEWFFMIYELILNDNPRFKQLIDSRKYTNSSYTINEWNVPMEKLTIDWANCLVQSVRVSLSNRFAPLQVQLQDEPTMQHIGGGDSNVEVSMIVIGEDNLIRFRRLFEHVNGLARLEKAHGVLGFLGIKNVITALCGIKYVLPLSFEADTIPNYPHAYNVVMSFVDFDVMQQERERLSSEQQKYLVEQFGKRNPFLRLKQTWGLFSAYPDMPLDVRDENGEIVGHLDPDWYFRSFNTTNSDLDLFQWSLDADVVSLIKRYAEIEAILLDSTTPIEEKAKNQAIAEALEQKAINIVNQGGALPPGWEIRDGHLRPLTEMDVADERGLIQIQYLGSFDEKNPDMISFIALFEGGTFRLGQENVRTNKREYITGLSLFQEDNASTNLKGLAAIPGSVSYEKYQNEYIDKSSSPARQYESMMQDFVYRSLKGRMVKAFPTYMLWLIDEGGRFAGIKLFDNFYGLNSVVDFSILQSEDSTNDTLVLRLSNIYQKLTTPYKDVVITEDDPLYDTPIGRMIVNAQNRDRNLRSGLTDEIIELNNIRLKPGVRVHLRMGYGSNPNALQTVFNGTIAEVEQGDIVTVIAQSDAVELTAFVNTSNKKGHSGTLDGGINTGFWLSEPRDLIVRLLSMGSSNFKEWMSWGSKGVLFSDSRFGIRHFGTILYEEMTKGARIASKNKSIQAAKTLANQRSGDGTVASFQAMLGDYTKDLSEISSIANLSNAFSPTLLKIGQALWLNSLSKRDFEIFKRNIYPGNGSGVAQFMGGDLIDAGITMSQVVAYYKSQESDNQTGGTGDSSNRSWWERPNRPPRSDEDNKKDLQNLWNYYESSAAATDEELIKLQDSANTGAPDLELQKEESPGLIDYIFTGLKTAADVMFPYEYLNGALGDVAHFSADITSFGIPVLSDINHFIADVGLTGPGDILSGAKRLAKSPLGKAIGLWSMNEDDDMAGYDEVSFRAQTYMKTVWDLFKVCAALLPNYIVAVRPFEDRSTLFYGKPHWLYTSGVIPVTTGVPRDSKPSLEDPDFGLNDLLKTAKESTSHELDRLSKLAEESQLLRNILQFNTLEVDPYTVGVVSTDEERNLAIAAARQARKEKYISDSLFEAFFGAAGTVSLTNVPIKVLQEDIFSGVVGTGGYYDGGKDGEAAIARVKAIAKQYIDVGNGLEYDTSALVNFLEEFESQSETGIYNQGIFETLFREINAIYGLKYTNDLNDQVRDADTGLAYPGAGNLPAPEDLFKAGTNIANAVTGTDATQILETYKNDPLGFAFNFGWKYSSIPVRVDPMSGYGTDTVGNLAYSIYGGSFGLQSRSQSEADFIWDSIRTSLRDDNEIHEVYDKMYPTESDKFDEFYDLFLRFLWMDPFNRAWPVIVLERDDNGVGDTVNKVNPFSSDNASYNWNPMRKLWTVFITSRDISVDEDNIVHAPGARRYMEQNRKAGSKADTIWENYSENISDWWDQNIGQVIGLINDTITGFVASIRLSLTQASTALSIASKAQVQANILNGILNDSIYYQEGRDDSILRLVDNPFTREYGEPVIEIREPFQRLHYISSFDSILDNQIKENINNVATVVTAVSDGSHPVTVHLDKGVPPDRQVEKTVETGLFWDNTFGAGLFGFLQPLLHPIETLRGYAKLTTGSADELSSRRIALYHLRESLKDIYTGEITILGNADIRPHDLVYIADVYERMYGMVEVEQVIHHFTPESGFVTAITPNAIVTVNDPVKWTFLSWIWSKMHTYDLRNDVRAALAVKAERNVAAASSYLEKDDIYKNFGVQLNGGIQWTHGNSALVRDIGAMFTANGVSSLSKRDEVWSQVQTIDVGLSLLKSGGTIAGALGGGIATGFNPAGAIVGGAGAWAITDLLWQGWQWVKENLLDQHGCFPAGAPVLTENGYTPIELVKSGDKVFTHLGRWRTVTNTMSREIDENIYQLKIDKLGAVNLTPTKEHPFLVFKKQDVMKYNKKKTQDELDGLVPQWIQAKDLEEGDYVIIQGGSPVDKQFEYDLASFADPRYYEINQSLIKARYSTQAETNRNIKITPDLMYVIGRYLGDGSIAFEKGKERGFEIVFNRDEQQSLNRIYDIIHNRLGLSCSISESTITHMDRIRCGNSIVGSWLNYEFGHGFSGKKVPEWVFKLPREHLIEILRGLFGADGCIINADNIRLDVSNRNLAMTAYRILRILGANPSFNGGRIQPGGTTPCYRVQVHLSFIPELAEEKGVIDFKPQTRQRGFIMSSGLMAYRLKKIDQIPYSGTVYNFSVEEDESYIVDGVVSHNCYIQYLNKDGQPMDAGLSYFQGVAVGTNHTVSLFPSIVGIRTPAKEDGHYRITTDDLLASLGWTEVETVSLFRETSMYVNQINKQILTISGRDPIFLNENNQLVITGRVLDPYGESTGNNNRASGVVDGDTLNVRVIDGGESGIAAGTVIKVRLSLMNASELEYYDNPYTESINEALQNNPTNDLGRMAVDYLINRFSNGINRYIAIRVDKFNQYDSYGRLIGVVFINAPLGTTDSKRLETLKKIASRSPAVTFDSYLEDGRPYTLNWELVMTGYGNIDMRESLWNTGWRDNAINYYSG